MLAASSKPAVAAASGWTPAAISGLLDLWDQQSGCATKTCSSLQAGAVLSQYHRVASGATTPARSVHSACLIVGVQRPHTHLHPDTPITSLLSQSFLVFRG